MGHVYNDPVVSEDNLRPNSSRSAAAAVTDVEDMKLLEGENMYC